METTEDRLRQQWTDEVARKTYETTKAKQKEKLKWLLWKKKVSQGVNGLGETVVNLKQEATVRYWDDTSIVILPADKGNINVIVERSV